MVLVDTSVWSLALRRKAAGTSHEVLVEQLGELVREGRAQLIGSIRQELLTGIRDTVQYRKVRDRLRSLDDTTLTREDYEDAAEASNTCRTAGVAGSPIDFLICAVALRRNWPIFTTDADFGHFSRHIPIRLYEPRRSS